MPTDFTTPHDAAPVSIPGQTERCFWLIENFDLDAAGDRIPETQCTRPASHVEIDRHWAGSPARPTCDECCARNWAALATVACDYVPVAA